MASIVWLKPALMGAGVCTALVLLFQQLYVHAPDVGQLGGPIAGLTPAQLRKFYATRERFKHDFTPEEGLGPLFNGRSCFECHGKPLAVGGEGRDVAGTGVVRIGKRNEHSPNSKKPLKEVMHKLNRFDVNILTNQGGPAIERKSITTEFPDKYPHDCQVDFDTIPTGTELVSMRHSPPVFGFGLIEAIPDSEILNNVFRQVAVNPKLVGRPITHMDLLTETYKVGKFGWKAQQSSLINFSIEALNVEMGITTHLNAGELSNQGGWFPRCIYKLLPKEPNDEGQLTAQLAYHQALLAPPARGPITPQVKRGEKLFEKLQCAVCHMPELSTAPIVYVIDPDSPAPKYNYMQIDALSNKPVRAYSDFLLHNMGPILADGVPQEGANGGEWRTTPLWGLRHKKFYLHDGRTQDLTKAILAHRDGAKEVVEDFEKLPLAEQEDLLAFLKSL